ncbi:MAG: hypothetical protein ACXV3F_08490 [Frankiaceae bacterium]
MRMDQRTSARDDDIGLEGAQGFGEGTPDDPLRRAWDRYGKDPRKRRTWTPFLVVPYKSVNPVVPGQTPDLGRTRPVPSAEAFWASPYIVVENSGGIGLTARASEENFVRARVFNFGKATSAPTQVDFYWADPSLGLTPGTFHRIGTEWVEIRHGASLEVRCRAPWVPVVLNGGHECLVINTSNPMMAVPAGVNFGPFDPIQMPFAPRLDRHVGQRNLTVVPGTAGKPMTVSVTLTNMLPFGALMVITLQAAMVAIDPEFLDRFGEVEVLTGLPALIQDQKAPREGPVRLLGRRPAVTVDIGEASGEVPVDAGRLIAARLVQHVGRAGPQPRHEVVARVEMRPGEQRQVEIVAEVPDAEPGQFAVVTVGQLWEDLLLGAYTLVGSMR